MYMAESCSGNLGKYAACLVMGEPEQACPSFLSSKGRRTVAFSVHVPSASPTAAQAIQLKLFAVTLFYLTQKQFAQKLRTYIVGMQVGFGTCSCCSVTCDFL